MSVKKETVVIHGDKKAGQWPRVEKYVNTTLRYPPPQKLAGIMEQRYGRPRVFRCWLTLDEMWDYRTDEYNFNYKIGMHKYDDDPNVYRYDWDVVVPSEEYIQDHLKAISPYCDAMMLNIRRYEREVLGGLVSKEQYCTIVEKGIRHYKALCPNIKYIEALNESEVPHFGKIEVQEYYMFYQWIYKIVAKLNREMNYDIALEVGGPTYCGGPDREYLWRKFLQYYSEDTDPEKQLAFFSYHDYRHEFERIEDGRKILDELFEKYGIEKDLPIFMDEYGWIHITPEPYDNLINAMGITRNMIRAAKLHDFHIFPWCSFHDPIRQLSLTQFFIADDGQLKAAPCGCAVEAVSKMKSEMLEVENGLGATHAVAATSDKDSISVIAVRTEGEEPLEISIDLKGIGGALGGSEVKVTQYVIDSEHSNALLNYDWDGSLEIVSSETKKAADLKLNATLENYALSLWIVEKL